MNQISKTFVSHFAKYHDVVIVLNGNKSYISIGGDEKRSITDFDLVYFKQTLGCAEYSSAIASFLRSKNTQYICDEVSDAMSLSKISEYARLDENQLPIPKTVLVHRFSIENYVDTIIEELGLPLVMKDASGRKGLLNFRLSNKEEIIRIAKENSDIDFVFQEFTENTGDYRLLVLGDKIGTVIYRERLDDELTHINTGAGSVARLIDPEDVPELCRIALESSKVMKRQIAGVDIAIDSKSGRPVIFEVNDAPQIASGKFVPEKLAATNDYLHGILNANKTDLKITKEAS
jgi:ribosomal protein S6--L-glutamate ligase/gamma-F420-2:alpha-L-glutamate ligase